MYIVIEHCNGEIMDDPFIIWNEKDLKEFIEGEYLVYLLDNYVLYEYKNITIGELTRYKKI